MEAYKNSYKSQDQNLISLSIQNTGYQKCLPGHSWGPAIRDHYLLHHVVCGKGYYKVNGKWIPLEAGDTFLIYPFVEVSYYADEQNPWEYAWVGFRGTDVHTILKASGFSKQNVVMHQNEMSTTIRRRLLQIYKARGNDIQHALQMTGELYKLFSLFMKEDKEVTFSSYQVYTNKAIHYIQANYSYPIRVEDVAQYVGISRSHLFRAFQESMQTSVKEYLTMLRIQHAKQLLRQGHLSMQGVAYSVGYEDSVNFAKRFHKATGMSPSAYVKSKNSSESTIDSLDERYI